MALPANHVLHGKYRLVRLLGDGGMGAVYEALHERLGTRVAIKVLHAELTARPGIVDRFLREARVSAQIRSAQVAQTMDVDRTPEGDAYMVMELLEGETLLHLLERERKLSVGVACAFTLQILAGLEAAHDLGVVHRDLKPENVFVTHGSQKTGIKLIDFGIAKAPRDGGANLTMAGVTMGTAEYMAPEQAFSADKADARSDVYAVGVMLYEMLSGVRPVTGDDPRIIAIRVERGEVKPLVHALPSVPPPLAGLVHRAMAARPELRFQSAAEMRIALEKLVGHDAGGTLPLPLAVGRRPQRVEAREASTGTLRGTPVEEGGAGGTAYEPGPADAAVVARPSPDVFTGQSDPPPPPRSSVLPLVALLAILLGVGVVVALAALQQPRTHAAEPPPSASSVAPAESLAALPPSDPTSAQPTATALPSLTKTATVAPKHPPLKADAGARTAPSSSHGLPLPNVLPLPSSLPPIPTALPTDLVLPGFGP